MAGLEGMRGGREAEGICIEGRDKLGCWRQQVADTDLYVLPTRTENPKPGEEYRDREPVFKSSVRCHRVWKPPPILWVSLNSEETMHTLGGELIPYQRYIGTIKGTWGCKQGKSKRRLVSGMGYYNNVKNTTFICPHDFDMATSDKYAIFL